MMEVDTAVIAVKHLVDDGLLRHRLKVVWHAGEPLIASPSFYRMVSEKLVKIMPPEVSLRQTIQTNGTLINEEWCKLFREFNFSIGISIDGPAWLNDANRINRRKRGTTNQVLYGIEKLRLAGIPFYTLSVLTRESLAHPDEVFSFLVDTGPTSLCFSVEEIEGIHGESSLNETGADEAYMQFMRRVLGLAASRGIAVREAEYMTVAILGRSSPGGLSRPLEVISVAANGDFSTFSPELLTMRTDGGIPLIFGNVHTTSYRQVLTSEVFQSVAEEIARGISMCERSCDYFSICGGGAPSNKLAEHKTFEATETVFCRLSRKRLADVMLERLEANLVNNDQQATGNVCNQPLAI